MRLLVFILLNHSCIWQMEQKNGWFLWVCFIDFIFLLFWNYNIFNYLISSFPFISLQILPYASNCSLSNIWPLFWLIVVTSIYVYAYIFWNITSLVCMRLIGYLFSELTIYYWVIKWCAFPWANYLSSSEHCFIVCTSLCRGEPLWDFPDP